jgi:hypothetical protein
VTRDGKRYRALRPWSDEDQKILEFLSERSQSTDSVIETWRVTCIDLPVMTRLSVDGLHPKSRIAFASFEPMV